MIEKILPDFCYSSRSLSIEGAVIHYFSAINVDPPHAFNMTVCRNLFIDLNRPRDMRTIYMLEEKWPDRRLYASAHVLIGQDGEIWKLVPFDHQAYHAGASIMNGRKNCNRWTLGIELVGTAKSGFTQAQYSALAGLLLDQGISLDVVAGHDTVRYAAIRGGSAKPFKIDPSGKRDGSGDNFDWPRLRGMVTACLQPPEPDQ